MDGGNGVRRRSTIDAIKRQQLGAVEGRLGQCYTVDVGQWWRLRPVAAPEVRSRVGFSLCEAAEGVRSEAP